MESGQIPRFIFSHLLILLTIISLIPVAVSADEVIEDITAKNVKVTPEYVEADGVCSCSLMEDRSRHKAIFENYCPACGAKGTLSFEEGSRHYTCPEGMWFCTSCDADFCLIHGKEHREGTKWYLKTYKKPTKNKSQVSATSKIEIIKENWTKYSQERIII